MANNILKGIISVEAPNVAQTAAKVSQATDKMAASFTAVETKVEGSTKAFSLLQKQVAAFGGGVNSFTNNFQKLPQVVNNTETALKKLPNASNAATLSLVNLGRVVQDAPFGFLGIANNLNPLLESFQRLKATTGTTGGALSALGKSLVGAGGLGIAVSVVSSLLIVFGDRLFGASKKSDEAKKSLESLNLELESSKQRVDDLGNSLQLLNQLGAINIKIFGLSQVLDLQGQYVSNQEEIGRIDAEVAKAQSLYSKAVVLNQKQANEESKKAEDRALENLRNAQKKRQEFADKGRVIAREIELQKVEDFKKALDEQQKAYEKWVAEQISKGKAYAAELKKIGAIVPDFTPFDTQAEALQKALKVIREFNTATLKFEIPVDFIISEPPEEVISNSKSLYNRTGGVLGQEFVDGFREAAGPTDFTLIDAVAEEKKLKGLQQGFIKIGEGIGQFVTPAIDAMVNAIGEGKNAFQAFGQAVGQILLGVIKKLIQAAVLALIISAISGGSANAAKGGLSFAQAFKGAFGGFRAGGGPVSAGTGYVVGENGPEYFVPNTGGTIIPNGGGGSFAGAMGNGMGKVVFEIQGNKLVGVLANASRSQARLS